MPLYNETDYTGRKGKTNVIAGHVFNTVAMIIVGFLTLVFIAMIVSAPVALLLAAGWGVTMLVRKISRRG